MQYKLREVFAQDCKKIISGLKSELKLVENKNSQGRKKKFKEALKDVYDRKGYHPAKYVFFTKH